MKKHVAVATFPGLPRAACSVPRAAIGLNDAARIACHCPLATAIISTAVVGLRRLVRPRHLFLSILGRIAVADFGSCQNIVFWAERAH